jgi:hypothetical protein
MRRRKLLVALVGLAVVVAAGVVLLWPQPEQVSRVTSENSDRILKGMNRAEVVAILGPPGDYRTVQTVDPNPFWWSLNFTPTPAHYAKAAHDREHVFVLRTGTESRRMERLTWLGNEGDIFVWLDTDGVSSHGFRTRVKVTQTPLESLLWRLKRQWHRWFPE